MVANALSKRYALISTLSARLLGFKHVKTLYESDPDFSTVYTACEVGSVDKFYRHDGYLLRENKLCIPTCSVRKLLVLKSHGGELIGHFSVAKTLATLREHYY